MKILCAVDFSDFSRDAARVALRLTREGRGELTLLHVFDYPSYQALGAVPSPELESRASEEADRHLEELRASLEAKDVPVAVRRVRGVAADEIVKQADAGGYDLIVLGTHGRTGLKRVLIGSVAEQVVRRAPCDVHITRRKP